MVGAAGTDNRSRWLNQPRTGTLACSAVAEGEQYNAAARLLLGGYRKSRWRALQEILCRSALVTLAVASTNSIRKTWHKDIVPIADDRSG